MLTCENLELAQGDFRLRADVKFPEGAVTAVIGPSGAGKSTLLSAIAGFVEPRSGQVLLNGKAFTDDAPGKRPVSMLFQDNNLFPHLTVAENVGLGLGLRRKLNVAERQSVSDVLGRVGFDQTYVGRKPSALSGGQQSRVALARVLLSRRPVVLLDEPFAALGPALKDDMLDLMRGTLREATVLMVTHNPADAKRIADYVVWVAGGVVHPPVATARIFADPPADLRSYLGKMG